jgi:soluble lytic murein transglycosylase
VSLDRRSRCAFVLALALLIVPPSRGVVGSVPAPPVPTFDLLEAQGEWRAAAATLHADSTVAAAGDPAAALARVRLAVRRRDNATALAALETHAAVLPADGARLARAALQLRSGDATASLATLAVAPPPAGLEAWAALLTAEAAIALERWETARAAAAHAATTSLPPEARARWALVHGRLAQVDGDAAAFDRMTDELVDAAKRDDRGGLLLWSMARDYDRRGDSTRARTLRAALLESRPTPAESAYVDLLRAPMQPSLLLPLARFEMRSGRHAEARARLRAAIIAGLPVATRTEARLLVAESWFKSGEPAQCLQALERAALDTRGTDHDAERLRLRARAERALGRRDAAMRDYKELATRFPRHERADDALYEVGWLLEQGRRFAAAEQAYLRTVRAYPKGSLADDALLRAGLCALRSHQSTAATEHFASLLARHARSTLVDNALYWQMLALIDRGDPAGALVLRDRLERDFPRSYFTALARRRVEQGLATRTLAASEPQPAPALGSTAGDGLAIAARAHAAWDSAVVTLRRAYGEPMAGFSTQARAWRFWLDWGFEDEAAAETRWLERQFDNEPAALLELAASTHARGAHARLVRIAYLLSSRHGSTELRDALEVLAYPAPYAPTLAEQASLHGLSHAALLGLARQESAFDPRIDSAAGARGLMQIMPAVGKRLAAAAGDAAFHPDALYDPEVAMRLGCTLLAAELREAGGDLPRALAAYNAGGDRAATWKSRLAPGEPPELYVDVVEFYETRTYLKTVLGNAETYRRLYALH